MPVSRWQHAGAKSRWAVPPLNETLENQEKAMKKLYPVAIALFLFSFASFVFAREAKLVR
jgi:hypothetical protein